MAPKDSASKLNGEKPKKPKAITINKTHALDDDDEKWNSDTEYRVLTSPTKTKAALDGRRQVQEPKRQQNMNGNHGGRDFQVNGRKERRERQYSPDSEPDYNTLQRQGSNLVFLGLSRLSIYDHCLRLRKHDIPVKLDPANLDHEAIATMDRLNSIGELGLRPMNNYGRQNTEVDIQDPSQQEIQMLNQSIALVLAIGGSIDISGFESPMVISCSGCSEQFFSQAEKDEHCSRGRTTCPRCPMLFPCKAARDTHMVAANHHNGAKPRSPVEQNFVNGRNDDYWSESNH